MRISEVTHRRIRNLGNYENAEITLTAVIEEGDDVKEVLQHLRDQAREFLYPGKPQ